jgi:cytochrome c oxidase subunit III
MADTSVPAPEVQYANLAHQGETAELGIWAFLINETVFFGALIFTYYFYRLTYPHEFAVAAKDAVLWCGTLNLVILVTSSLTIVLGINAAAQDARRDMVRWLVITCGLGFAFLAVKGFEYYLDVVNQSVPVVDYLVRPGEGSAGELFWVFYWVATGLHAIHLATGIGLVFYMLWRIRRGEITSAYYTPLEVVGIYWSFVDVVWLFLYPCIYLVGRS